MTDTSWLEIDLAAVDANLAAMRDAAGPGVAICAVVKANAYGLGAVQVAKRLSADGVELLAVYDMDEARELTQAGVPTPLLMLMPIHRIERTDVLYRAMVAHRLHLVVHSERQLVDVEQIGRTFGVPVPIHVELDSGMSRGGMSLDEASRVLPRTASMRYVRLAGVFTHPASAATSIAMTNRQMHLLDQLLDRNADALRPDTQVHFANTYATLRDRKYHRDMIRVGLGLYGYGQDAISGSTAAGVAPLRHAVRWVSRVVHIQRVASGSPVGYNATFTTWRDSVLGIVPAGYGLGYPVALTGRGAVRVGPRLQTAEVRGQVNMDQIIIDLTEVADPHVGMSVEIYGADPDAANAIPAVADAARTNPYEILCRLADRLPRRYLTQKPTA